MFNRISASLAVIGVALLVSVPNSLTAKTITGNEATVTFDHSVEVPGKVLPAGTYVFKTTDNDELVQVFSANYKEVFATFFAIPAHRSAMHNDDSFVQLNRTPAGAPQEIDELFVAGRTTGYQFVYPANKGNR
jgi:hypothetical protein